SGKRVGSSTPPTPGPIGSSPWPGSTRTNCGPSGSGYSTSSPPSGRRSNRSPGAAGAVSTTCPRNRTSAPSPSETTPAATGPTTGVPVAAFLVPARPIRPRHDMRGTGRHDVITPRTPVVLTCTGPGYPTDAVHVGGTGWPGLERRSGENDAPG